MDTTSLPSNRAADALGNSTAEPSPQNAMGVAQFLHLLAAYSLVIAQPVFDRLKDNTGYLTQQAMSPAVIVIGTLLISLLVPVLLFAACVVVHRFSPWHSRALLLVILGILFALGENLINQAFAGWLVRHQPRVIISGIFYLSVAVLTAWWLIRQYQRKAWISQFLSLASISVILFPASLLTSGPMQPVLFPDQLNGLGTPLHAAHPQPIVWIVFDGLAGMAILGSDRQIDAVRYPNFAKLAGMSTYYRNASTVHPRTDAAVPAMLCSTYPIKQSMPVLVNHPDNLFTLLIRTQQFDPVVFEP